MAELGFRYRPSVQADLEAHAATLALLTKDVAHLKPESLETAARQWAQTSPFMPKAAELIGLVREIEKPSFTDEERLRHANANIDEANERRRREGFGPVHWILRDGELVIESLR